MNNAWRPIIGSLAAIAATIWAATLLALYHYPSRAAAALLIGAALVALILSQDLLSNLISRFSQDYKGSVATVVSVGFFSP
jgi:mitochondrial fission protein ELM1